MSLHALLQAFATVFPAELPDKTMVATIVLVTRYRRPALVWVGAAAAFAVHVVVAVAAGSAIGRLPDALVQAVGLVLFAVGSVLLLLAARAEAEVEEELEHEPAATARATVLGSFGLIVVAEWGDLTQLATASLAARSGAPLGTGLGAWLALAAVAAIAVGFGRTLVHRVPLHKVNYLGAAVFAALAAWTAVELARTIAS
jgi:putative Ca2+/H+ antiporter (TMEM165/GDT1 family)